MASKAGGKGLGRGGIHRGTGSQYQEENREKGQGSVLEDNLLAMRTLVMGDVAPDVDPADTVLSVLLILPSAGPCPTTSSCTPCGLQKGRVWAPGSLVDQDIQGLLKDPGFWEFHLQNASNPQLPTSGPGTQPTPPPAAPVLAHLLAFAITGSLAWTVCPLSNFMQQIHTYTSRCSSEVSQLFVFSPLLPSLLVYSFIMNEWKRAKVNCR